MPTAHRTRKTAPGRTIAARVLSRSGDRAPFIALCLFAGIVFAMGGASRADVASLVLLRPLAFLFAGYALLNLRSGDLASAAFPLGVIAALGAIMAIQLVPLPPALWTHLPGRDLYADIARDAGLPLPVRALSLAPARTVNALFALGVPLAAVLLAAIQGESYRRRIPMVIMIGCCASALLAVAQVASPGNGLLYFYRITNADFPVGLMANRNHQAALMAILLVLIADQYRRFHARRPGVPLTALTGVAALVVLALILVSGSRAGLFLAAAALAIGAFIVVSSAGPSASPRGRRITAAAGAVAMIGILTLSLYLSRSTSIERLLAANGNGDFRLERLPIVLGMLREHWLFGIGFGAFEGVFKRYEPTTMLSPFIFNQAHSDWLQLPMEGGLLGSAVLIVACGWFTVRASGIWSQSRRGQAGTRFAALSILLLCALASAVDYPLRTPVFMLVAGICAVLISPRQQRREA
jgi:O-antigen ligase